MFLFMGVPVAVRHRLLNVSVYVVSRQLAYEEMGRPLYLGEAASRPVLTPLLPIQVH
jgi:hypothetical protein